VRGNRLPSLIAGLATEEYSPPAPGRAELMARQAVADAAPWPARTSTAMILRAFDRAAGGGFFSISRDAEHDAGVAEQVFDRGPGAYVIDVQTHLVNPARWSGGSAEALAGFLAMVDPDRWADGIDPTHLSAARWAAHVFGQSQTNVALLTSLPGRAHENVLTNPEIAGCRDLVDRYTGTGRVLTHAIVHPNLGRGEIDQLPEWSEELRPAGWKVYTLWDPPEQLGPGGIGHGWFLDDEEIGIPFLDMVQAVGPRIVCAHKGIGAPVPGASPAGSSPRDIGPVARRYPDLTFVVYHSGYEVDPDGEEGPYTDATRDRGVNRLVSSLEESGVEPGANVYAELGSTWYLALRRPREAAHVLGKLLVAVGEDRILWGTDSIWYGSPQSLIDSLWTFEIPEDMQAEFGYPALTPPIKNKILWENAAELYGVTADVLKRAPSPIDQARLDTLTAVLK
jgi:predicted TIM-barrel fold metal-dependent hydrolase